jgi:hypothetical protein
VILGLLLEIRRVGSLEGPSNFEGVGIRTLSVLYLLINVCVWVHEIFVLYSYTMGKAHMRDIPMMESPN